MKRKIEGRPHSRTVRLPHAKLYQDDVAELVDLGRAFQSSHILATGEGCNVAIDSRNYHLDDASELSRLSRRERRRITLTYQPAGILLFVWEPQPSIHYPLSDNTPELAQQLITYWHDKPRRPLWWLVARWALVLCGFALTACAVVRVGPFDAGWQRLLAAFAGWPANALLYFARPTTVKPYPRPKPGLRRRAARAASFERNLKNLRDNWMQLLAGVVIPLILAFIAGRL